MLIKPIIDSSLPQLYPQRSWFFNRKSSGCFLCTTHQTLHSKCNIRELFWETACSLFAQLSGLLTVRQHPLRSFLLFLSGSLVT